MENEYSLKHGTHINKKYDAYTAQVGIICATQYLFCGQVMHACT